MLPRKHYHAKYTRTQLVEELYKDYMTQDFNNLKISDDNENMDSVPFEEQARRMEPITPDGGVKKKVINIYDIHTIMMILFYLVTIVILIYRS